jgi:hypothetical protein
MKKAKVVKGAVQKVWPDAKGKPFPAHVYWKDPSEYPWLVDVPDEVQVNWVWDGEKYAPRKKVKALEPRAWVLEVICEKLGTTYAEVKAEAKRRKLDALAALAD